MPVTSNIIEFRTQLRDFSRAVKLDYEKAVRAILMELFRRIVINTPVDTGRTAMNWGISKGSAGTGVTEAKGDQRRALQQAISKVQSISVDPPEGVYWIYNNLPHIQKLEFGMYPKNPKRGSRVDAATGRILRAGAGKNVRAVFRVLTINGYSKKAPAGMVRIAIAATEANIETIIAAARGVA